MEKQNAKTVLMIEPFAFGYNVETAVNNYFQHPVDMPPHEIQQLALSEFSFMVEQLKKHEINVIAIKDTVKPVKPDSIFPNNWISFHENGVVVIYPLYAENRRRERRNDIIKTLNNFGYHYSESIDYTHFEKENEFLEGTGSMVFDRENKICYAALSERTNYKLITKFCLDFGYSLVSFEAFQTVELRRLPIYHTNVMLCIADKYAVVCLDSIDKVEDRKKVLNSIVNSGKTIIEISEKQTGCFAGNMLQLENTKGDKKLIMSESAFKSLEKEQISKLNNFNELVVIPVPTIEKYGGGSVRCMMAEVF